MKPTTCRPGCLALMLGVVLLLNGCSSAGKMFNHEQRKVLALGVTSYDDAMTILGESSSSSEVRNEDGIFKTVGYVYAHRGLLETAARALTVEFRNGVLNGILYVSNFSDDKTDFDATAVDKINVKSSTKADALKIFGDPSGKILCPSVNFSSDCGKGKEIWAWVYTPLPGQEQNDKKVIIHFDSSGIVVQIATGSSTIQ